MCAALVLTGQAIAVPAAARADTGCPVPVAYPGSGTSMDPYLISTPGHLQQLRDTSGHWASVVRLTADIDMGSCVWTSALGDSRVEFLGWTGTFDGDGHVITGLDVHITSTDLYTQAGLFGRLHPLGQIKYVGFMGDVSVDLSYSGGNPVVSVGGLLGEALDGTPDATIDSVYAVGSITVNATVTAGAGNTAVPQIESGGLVGYLGDANIAFSYADVTAGGLISATAPNVAPGQAGADYSLGGLVGYLSTGSISYSYGRGTASFATTGGADTFAVTTAKGGVVGTRFAGAITDSLFETGGTWVNGVGSGSQTGTSGHTSAELKNLDTYLGEGWTGQISQGYDAMVPWGICPGFNDGYPYLADFHASNPCGVCSTGATWVYDDTDIQSAVANSVDDSIICVAAEIDLSSTLQLDDTTLTLEGAYGSAALDGGDARQILHVDFMGAGDDHLQVRNLILRDGNAGVSLLGGVISVLGSAAPTDDSMSIAGATFESSTADSGGAIHSSVPLLVDASLFVDNSVSSTGGAIYSTAPVALENAEFRGNAAGSGGAVTASEISTSGGVFRDNIAVSVGGALEAVDGVTSTNDDFTLNESTNSLGGAIWCGCGPGEAVVVDGSTFVSNQARSASSDGGAIWSQGPVNVRDALFKSNKAGRDGGAIKAPHIQGETTFFRGNYAANSGGAVWAETVTISRTTLFANGLGTPATAFGGGLYIDDTAALINVTSYFNTADDTGGFLASGPSAGDMVLTYVTALDDNAAEGAAIAVLGTGSVSLIGTVLTSTGAAQRCFDADTAPANANFAPDSAGSYSSDWSCGTADDSITRIDALRTTWTAPPLSDDTPGSQVLYPDASSILVNAVPSTLVPDVTTDQLGTSRLVPAGLTTAGAVQVLPSPSFNASPQSQSVTAGATATFTSSASGGTGTVDYSWRRSLDGGATWAVIPGAVSATYSLAGVALADSGMQVQAVATDANGRQALSSAATLTVTAAPIPPAPGPGPAPGPTPTPTPSPVPPSAPIIERVVAGDDTAIVEFVPTLDDSVLRYEYTLDDSTWIAGDTPITQSPFIVRDLDQGTTYRVRVRGVNEAGPGAASDAVEFTTTGAPTVTIVITGAREGRRIAVVGNTTGLVGQAVTPRFKLRGERAYRSGRVEPIVDADGRFTWGRKTGKKAYVYFEANGVRSNRVVIPARTGSTREGLSLHRLG